MKLDPELPVKSDPNPELPVKLDADPDPKEIFSDPSHFLFLKGSNTLGYQAEDAACHVGGPQEPHHQGEETETRRRGEV